MNTYIQMQARNAVIDFHHECDVREKIHVESDGLAWWRKVCACMHVCVCVCFLLRSMGVRGSVRCLCACVLVRERVCVCVCVCD